MGFRAKNVLDLTKDKKTIIDKNCYMLNKKKAKNKTILSLTKLLTRFLNIEGKCKIM